MELEKFFIKDSAINKKQDDAFSYIDYVNNLKKVIEHNEPPFNIAIIGKWGVGKSSIVNLLKEELKGKHEYKIQEINAWKYENTSLKKAFIKHLYKNLNGNKDDLAQDLRNLLNPSIDIKEKEETFSDFIKKGVIRTVAFLLYFILLSVILYCILMLFDLFNYWISNSGKSLGEVWKDYINPKSNINVYETLKSFKDKMFIPLAILGIGEIAKFVSAYKTKKVVKFEINPAIESTDEYEEKFIETLSKYKTQNRYFKKLIVVIDDLDRLSPKKIVDALDAIKAFVEVKECIFIVPFDDSILRKAINSKRLYDFSSLDGESYLDKLFQFKLILPPLIDLDMKEYAYNLCVNEIPQIFNLCPSFKTILEEILIYPYVRTPRQIIKIINTFVSNLLIVNSRENKKLEPNLITDKTGLNILAKVSVLQSDFPEFYEHLLQDNNSISKLLKKYNEQEDKDINSFGMNSIDTFNALISFLIKTEYIYTDNLAPFIYLGQDSLGLSAGDEKQRSIRKYLLSGNDVALIKYSENRVIADIDTRIIMQGINEAKTVELQQVLKVAMQIVNYIGEELIEEFSNLISNKINIINELNIEFRYWQVDFKNYLTVYRKAVEKKGIEKALNTVIKLVFEHNKEWKRKNGAEYDEELFADIIENLIEECLSNENILSDDVKLKLKTFINNEKYPVEIIISIYNNHRNLIKEYFSDNFYNRLCEYMGKEDIADEVNTIKALEEIAVTIREIDIERFSKPLTNVIINEMNALKVCELLIPVAGEVKIENAINLVNEFISFDYSEVAIGKIIQIIAGLNWKIDKIDNDKFNKFIIKSCEFNYLDQVNDILVREIYPNQYGLLINAIEYIVDKWLVNGSYDKVCDSIVCNFTLEQLNNIVNKIKNVVGTISNAIAVDKFNRCVSIIDILIKNNNQSHKLLSDMVSSMIIYYGNNYNYVNSYPQWAEAYTAVIGATKSVISEANLETYVGFLVNYVASYKPDIMIKGFYYLGESIPKRYVKDSINRIISYAKTFDTQTMGISYLKSIENFIKGDKDNVSLYAKFLISCIGVDTNTILSNLNDFYSSIGKENLINAVKFLMSDNTYDRDLAFRVVNKFFDKENKSEFIKEILLLENSNNSLEFIKDLLDYNNELLYKEVLSDLINGITDQETIVYLLNLLILSSYYKEKLDKKLIANLINYIWIKFGDSEINKMSDILINKYYNFKFRNAKSILTQNIIVVFKKSNMETKKKVLQIADMFDFNMTFKKASKENNFSDDEKKLIKEILRIV